MIIATDLDFITAYINSLDEILQKTDKRNKLSNAQREWLQTVLMGILITNSVSWAKIERHTLGTYSTSALCWMFCHTKILWNMLLYASVAHILKTYNITSGVLVLDDTDRSRSRGTKSIAYVHKMKDKKTGGFFNGQSIVQLLLVTDTFSIPVGFQFYQPDPAIAAYKKALTKYKNDTKIDGTYSRKLLTKTEFDQLLVKGFDANDYVAYETDTHKVMIYDVANQKHKQISLKKAKRDIHFDKTQNILIISHNKMKQLFINYMGYVNTSKKPQEPRPSAQYPTKLEIAAELVKQFTEEFPELTIKATVMDAGYSKRATVADIIAATKQLQVVTQIKNTQLVTIDGKEIAVKAAFDHTQDITTTVMLRGTATIVTYCNMKAVVNSHNSKYTIIALKYANETEYRYLIANDCTWRDVDIIRVYALRWLVEVFFEDWKANGGWNALAMQRGDDGSLRVVILSLLIDHMIILHPDQQALLKNNSPAATVGSMRQKIIIESLLSFIKIIAHSDNPKAEFDKNSKKILKVFKLMPSKKHMRSTNFNEFQAEDQKYAA